MVRNNICINSHPAGCVKVVRRQIDYVKKAFADGKTAGDTPRLALVIGCSTGYGLASRIAAAFGYGAVTVGISFEKAGSNTKPGTPGWYNNAAFDAAAAKAGLAAITLDGDAFSNEMKEAGIAAVREAAAKAGIPAQIDLVVYSLASPVRTDPATGIMHRSVIKPIGSAYSGETIDMMSGKIATVSAEPATDEEIAATIKVMGGEDWELWIAALMRAGVLAPAARTVAYTYIGPELSWAIYKNGTIGRAKEDLERAARAINKTFAGTRRRAFISVNKALVTRASAVIPVIPFYVSCLFRVMKDQGIHEGCIEQITRLYRERLYTEAAVPDTAFTARDATSPITNHEPEGNTLRVRIDDLEMRPDVQAATAALMKTITEENIWSATDAAGFKHDFLEAHGFDVAGIDYEAEVDPSSIGEA
jgi:enoyl-[acyl-carrier protein] reductase/trans-2-enoyl-CoA reductase (NAD+)